MEVSGSWLDRENKTLRVMIAMYCRGHHGERSEPLCAECRGLLDYARRRVASHFAPMATDGRWQGWWLRADPSQQAVRNAYKRDMIERHGTGAPTEQLAGKHVWNTRVRNPARKREAAVIEDSRAALDTLAGG